MTAINKLKEIRERHGLSQMQMGELLNIEQSTYQRLESGQTSLRSEQIVLLIKQFGMGAKDLLEIEGIEIVFKDNSVSYGNNGKTNINTQNIIPSEVLNKILDELNEIKGKLR